METHVQQKAHVQFKFVSRQVARGMKMQHNIWDQTSAGNKECKIMLFDPCSYVVYRYSRSTSTSYISLY